MNIQRSIYLLVWSFAFVLGCSDSNPTGDQAAYLTLQATEEKLEELEAQLEKAFAERVRSEGEPGVMDVAERTSLLEDMQALENRLQQLEQGLNDVDGLLLKSSKAGGGAAEINRGETGTQPDPTQPDNVENGAPGTNPIVDADYEKFKELARKADKELSAERWKGAVAFAMAIERDRILRRNVKMGVNASVASSVDQIEKNYRTQVDEIFKRSKAGELSPDAAKQEVNRAKREATDQLNLNLLPDQVKVYNKHGGIKSASHHTK